MKNLGHSIPFPFLWIRQLLQRFGRWIAYKLEDTNQKEGKRNSIAVLDGVRAIAILMVIVFHINRITGDSLWNQMANPLASSVATAGGTGVTLFFVLSGFLLFMPFAKALLFDTPWPLARVFYLRRVLRSMPGDCLCATSVCTISITLRRRSWYRVRCSIFSSSSPLASQANIQKISPSACSSVSATCTRKTPRPGANLARHGRVSAPGCGVAVSSC